MNEATMKLDFLPQPEALTSQDIALLTENSQKILVCLAHEGNKTLTELATSVGMQSSTTFESLDILEKSKIVEKNQGKVYGLTRKGKLLSFMLLKPNGQSEQTIRTLFDNFLEQDLAIHDSEYRKTVVEQLRQAI